MDHWLDVVLTILRADTCDLRELAKVAGGDPRTFYRNTYLADLELEGQNVEGMEFAEFRTGGIKRSTHPQLPEGLTDLGRRLNAFLRLIELELPFTTSEATFLSRARKANRANQPELAAAILWNGISYFENSSELWVNLVRAVVGLRWKLEGIALAEYVTKRFPATPVAWATWGDVLRASRALPESAKVLREAAQSFPDNPKVLLSLSYTLLQTNPQQAAETFGALVRLDIDNHQYRRGLASALDRCGKGSEASKIYLDLVKLRLNKRDLLEYVDQICRRGDDATKRAAAIIVLKMYNEYGRGLDSAKWIGDAVFRLGEVQMALSHYTEVERVHFEACEPIKWKSDIMLKSGMYTAALAELNNAVARFPTSNLVKQWLEKAKQRRDQTSANFGTI